MMTDDQLNAIEARAEAATAGPWFGVATDDEMFMNARYVGTVDRGNRHDHYRGMTDGREGEIIAITLVQSSDTPACHDSEKWDENTDFIAHARTDIPALVAEVRRLQKAIDSACDKLDGVVGNMFSVGERVVRLDHLASTAYAMWAEQHGAESEGA